MIKKIVSGGQTGVDRAALDIAIHYGISHGGWCPSGRLAEDGILADCYLLTETPLNTLEADLYKTRTMWNIRDSDATLILVPSIPLPDNIKDGTLLTLMEVERTKKESLIINLSENLDKNKDLILNWINHNMISTLNVAGPRESSSPGIYIKSCFLLGSFFESFKLKLKNHF